MQSYVPVSQKVFQTLDKIPNTGVNLQSSLMSSSSLEVSAYTGASSLVFVDTSVLDYQNLIQGVKPGTEVHILDSSRDAIAQITETLLGRKGVSSLHIISHGSVASLDFASSSLNTSNIRSYTNDLKVWSSALTTNADILLYGCNVAAGETGINFVQQLSQITGADIAASNDLTGTSRKGGNWIFETVIGFIESALALDMQAINSYDSVLAITINTPSATINNPSPALLEQFGWAIASDSNQIVIGAPGVNSRNGEAYRFTTGGTLVKTFANPSSSNEERFGFAVAINGNNYIISAPYFDDAVADVGRAYQLDGNGAIVSTYNNSVNNDDSEFGTAIAILSDGTIAVSAPERGKNQPTDNAGQVRLFKTGGNIINITNPALIVQDARFGAAIAASGNRLIIGAPGHTDFNGMSLLAGSGRAYSYDASGNSLQTFINPNPNTLDLFGVAVASNIAGTRVLIGAPGDDNSGTNAGVVYLYDTTGTTPALLKTFTNPNPNIRGFGTAVTFVGNDIVIGAPGGFDINGTTTTPAPDAGAAYLFDGDGTTPTYALDITFSNPGTARDGFGGAISVIDNKRIVIGAPYTDVQNNTDAGIAYVYDLTPNAAPVNVVPSTQIIDEDRELVFLNGNQNLIAIQDSDAGNNPVQVTLKATNGTLSLGSTNGIQFTQGDASGNANVTFTGTIANINAALNGMRFKPTANFDGAASIQITTNDLGNTGIGGAFSDTDTINITVKPMAEWEIVTTGDFTGDGKQDIIQRDETGNYRLWHLNANNIGEIITLPTLNSDWQIAGTGKFNSDKSQDILWRNYKTGENRVWLMGESGAIGIDLPSVNLDNDRQIEHVGDFDGDGDADILWRNYTTGRITLWEMDATNVVRGVGLPGVSDKNIKIEKIADFNGDGNLDILWRNYATGYITMWDMDKLQVKQGINLPGFVNPNVKLEAVADFNGDNDLDILWRDYATGRLTLWDMNGLQFNQSIGMRGIDDADAKLEAIADFDGDGKLDILWGDYTGGWHTIWKMNGTNVEQGIGLPRVADTSIKIKAVGDFNGNGKVDIVFYNSTTTTSTLWLMDGTSRTVEILLPNA